MKKIIILVVVVLCSSLGCVPLLVGGAIYGVQKGKQNKTERMKAYDEYRIEMAKINTERELNHLEPLSIPTFEEWNEKGSNK